MMRAIFRDRADVSEPGRAGATPAQMRVEDSAQQIGHAAAFALRACFQGLVLPVIEQDLRPLHVLHHTQRYGPVKDRPSAKR